MNIQPKGAPAPAAPAQGSARDRAIAKLMEGKTNPSPVPNPTQVAPEEMGALKTTPNPLESQGQSTTSEEAPQASQPEAEAPKPSVEESPEKTPLSSQYAMLARKEKALRAKVQAQEAAAKAREAALQSREDAIKAKESEYSSNYISKDKISQDPWTTLQDLGITYDQLTQYALNQPQQDPATRAAIAKIEAQVKAQAEEVAKTRQSYEDQQKRAYDQAVNQIRQDVKSTVGLDPQFETIQATQSVEDVVDLIKRTFEEDGVIMSVEDACLEVENYLVEEAMKIARLNKIKQRLSPPPAKEAPKPQETKQQQPEIKTLTNANSTARKLSARERALLAFEGKLK
jgi:hypothetical protein